MSDIPPVTTAPVRSKPLVVRFYGTLKVRIERFAKRRSVDSSAAARSLVTMGLEPVEEKRVGR